MSFHPTYLGMYVYYYIFMFSARVVYNLQVVKCANTFPGTFLFTTL